MSEGILVDCCICGGKVGRGSDEDFLFLGAREVDIEGGTAHRCCAEAGLAVQHWLFAVQTYVDETDKVPPVPVAGLVDWLRDGGELLEEHGLWLLDEIARKAAANL